METLSCLYLGCFVFFNGGLVFVDHEGSEWVNGDCVRCPGGSVTPSLGEVGRSRKGLVMTGWSVVGLFLVLVLLLVLDGFGNLNSGVGVLVGV